MKTDTEVELIEPDKAIRVTCPICGKEVDEVDYSHTYGRCFDCCYECEWVDDSG